MRKLSISHLTGIVILGASLALSCETGEKEMTGSPGQTTLSASTEQSTKTSLSPTGDGTYKVFWSEEDAIAVFIDGAATPNRFTLSAGEGTKQGSFSGYGSGSGYLAVYPISDAVGLDGTAVSLNLPSEQNYSHNSFGQGSYPMIAESSSSSLQFRNLCSLLKLSIKGHHTVVSIEFTSADPSCIVSGPATVETGFGSSPVLKMDAGGSPTVSLSTGGVPVNENEATDFYIALPPQTYKGGFSVKVNTSTGYMVKTYPSDFTMERSMVHESTPFTIKLDEGVDPSTSLEGSGTESDPFLIKNLEDLLYMQASVNASEGTIRSTGGTDVPANSAYYSLLDHIDLSPVCGEDLGRSWDPIGDFGSDENWFFTGTFNGNGHTIQNLYIDSDKSYRGFFGKAISSDWPYTGSILNLSVEGTVRSSKTCIALIAGEAYQVSYCVTNGSVDNSTGSAYTAGIVSKGYMISGCVNFASVSGGSMMGGITGSTSSSASDCVNEGAITSTSSYVGGIVGYQNAGYLYNCRNTGTVSGKGDHVGGITGYNRQGSKVDNCINSGNVSSGQGKVGGISGECYTWNESPDTAIRNCVNTGEVTFSATNPYYPDYIGGITGLNNSIVSNCYWLYDQSGNSGLEKGIGTDEGSSSGLHPLTEAQLKGDDTGKLLYAQTTGMIHTHLLGALNSWAYENRSIRPYWGWAYPSEDSYPEFTGSDATEPTEGDGLFNVNPLSVSIGARETSFTVTVTTTMDYSVSSIPDWVRAVSTQKSDSAENTWIHSYGVDINLESVDKKGEIVFTTSSGLQYNLSVVQGASTEVFAISPSSREVTAAGGEVYFDVESTLEYSISSMPDWIHEGKSETLVNLSNTVRHYFSVDMYSGSEQREGTIVFCNEDQQCVPATVIQKTLGTDPAIELSTLSVSVSSSGGESTINVISNVNWTVSSDQSWCTVSPSSGSTGDTPVKISISKNTGSSSRVAHLAVKSSDGSISKTVNVAQSSKKDFNADEWKDREFYHRSLFMRFTATWCGWCPRMNNSIKLAQQKYPDKLLYVALHNSDSDLAFSGTSSLKYVFGVSGFPTGVVDGRIKLSNQDSETVSEQIISASKETEQNYGTATGLALSSTVSGREIMVDVDAFIKYKGNYKITVMLLEDRILASQVNYEGATSSSYQHDNVARIALSSITGDAFSVSDDYSVQSFAFSANVPDEYDISNMKVLVYIQAEYGSRTVISSGNYGTFFVDNCVTVKVGEKLDLESAQNNSGGNEGILPGDDIDM